MASEFLLHCFAALTQFYMACVTAAISVPANSRIGRTRFLIMAKQIVKKKPTASWSFPPSKKGKTRLIMKDHRTKKPMSKKANSKAWAAVPYVRGPWRYRSRTSGSG